MSQTGNQDTFQNIASGVSEVVTVLGPLSALAGPEAPIILGIASKLIQGAIALEPTALSLVAQIKSGTPPAPAQLAQYAKDYEDAYQQLNADIHAKLIMAT